MDKRVGKQTVKLPGKPVIINACGIAGKKEGQGPLGNSFDEILADDRMGKDSWEEAESALQKHAAVIAMERAALTPNDIDCVFAGDLLNQCVGANYGMRELGIPYFGLYGACSTMAESLALGAMTVDGGFAGRVLCVTSSHFCSAEKQFRNPLEYGGQRAPSAQWTVTGAGCAVLAKNGNGPRITHITAGKIVDMGITDANNMGAAMAPAAIDTLTAHFEDLDIGPQHYDMILTGDLGVIGSGILVKLMAERGFDIAGVHSDCGKLIFDINAQDVHAGGSGCGCCGSVFCGHIYKLLKKKKLSRVLLIATGALMNTMTIQQGESIPAIAHAVAVECAE